MSYKYPENPFILTASIATYVLKTCLLFYCCCCYMLFVVVAACVIASAFVVVVGLIHLYKKPNIFKHLKR